MKIEYRDTQILEFHVILYREPTKENYCGFGTVEEREWEVRPRMRGQLAPRYSTIIKQFNVSILFIYSKTNRFFQNFWSEIC